MEFSAKTKRILLIIAAIFVLAAVCLYLIADNTDTYDWICDELKVHGMNISSSQLKYEGNAEGTSIRELIVTDDEELANKAIEASKKGGFLSDADAVGNVVLITAELENDENLTVYVFENSEKPMHVAVCFIQNTQTGEVRSCQ